MWFRWLVFLLPSICFAQDSTRSVAVPAWIVNRMIHEVEIGRSCDSLVSGLEREIDLSQRGLKAADTVLTVMEKRLQLAEEAQKVQGERVMNFAGENQELRKEIRKQKRLKLLAIIGIGLALLI